MKPRGALPCRGGGSVELWKSTGWGGSEVGGGPHPSRGSGTLGLRALSPPRRAAEPSRQLRDAVACPVPQLEPLCRQNPRGILE